MCSGKLRTYDTVQVVGRYEPDSFTNTPHFEAYKRLVEGFRADPPPLYLNASGSKSSEPTRGAISTLLEDLYMKPQTCCQVRISTCCCSSCGWKSFRAKKTASSSRRFMCHRLWDSSYGPEAGIPSRTAPQPWVDASVVIITRDTTEHRGTPRLKRSVLHQSFDVAAMRKHPEVHGTRDFSHSCSGRMCNNPRCNTAESATLSPSSLWNTFNWTELPCLKRRREDNWSRLDLARGGLSSPRDLMRVRLSSPRDLARGGGENALCMLTHSRRDSKWISSESVWLISVSRDWAKITQSSR